MVKRLRQTTHEYPPPPGSAFLHYIAQREDSAFPLQVDFQVDYHRFASYFLTFRRLIWSHSLSVCCRCAWVPKGLLVTVCTWKTFQTLFFNNFCVSPLNEGVALSQSSSEQSSLAPKLGCSFVPIQFKIVCPRYGGGGVYSFIVCLSHLNTHPFGDGDRGGRGDLLICCLFIWPLTTYPWHHSCSSLRHLQHMGAHAIFPIYYIETFCLPYAHPVWRFVANIYRRG